MTGGGGQPVAPRQQAYPGCLRSLLALAALVVLAPAAALVRSVARWRRGSKPVFRVRRETVPSTLPELIRIDLDLPPQHQAALRMAVTELVVRVAETLRAEGDSYHLLYREAALEECTVLPLGPQVQALGEQLALSLTRSALEGRTTLWLSLPARLPVAEIVDPVGYDPEAPGEPAGLLASEQLRWAAAVARRQGMASQLLRVELHLPRGASDRVNSLVQRLGER